MSFTPLFNGTADITRLVGALTTTSAVFDTSYDPKTVGFLYAAKGGYSASTMLPLSYWTSIDYFGDYAPKVASDLTVTDTFSSTSWQVTPSGTGADLQIERINTSNGTDIYDSACYQIALALANKNGIPTSSNYSTLNSNHVTWLTNGYDGNDTNQGSNGHNRAVTTQGMFYYGGNAQVPNQGTAIPTSIASQPTPNSTNSYLFRMIPQKWCALDPFFSPSAKAPDSAKTYQKYVTDVKLPVGSAYPKGTVTWLDWKPITGENVWALINGPIRAWQITNPGSKLTSGAPEYALATGVLTALTAMQSKQTGGIYYAAQGSLGNTGSEPVDPFNISTENNASTLGALYALQAALSSADSYQAAIATLITGILKYLKNSAWDATAKIFYQGGTEQYSSSGAYTGFTPAASPKAVDVNTWGVAAITPAVVDSWFGAGTAYTIWQNVKEFGGFYSGGTLMGVGYSSADGNGPSNSGGIMSAEWTFGAINMVRCLMKFYGTTYPDLATDEAAMVKGVLATYSDNYATAKAFTSTRPQKYASYMPTSSGNSNSWFIYASKRYFIPFGWYANPLPSLCSTSWALMVQYNYNPFSATGSY